MNNRIRGQVIIKETGDAAIDGLFGGLLAGFLMGVVLVLGGLLGGENPTQIMARFATGQSATPMAGSLVHLAVSSVYGVIFSLLVNGLPKSWLALFPGWLAGLLYGGVLLMMAVSILLPGLRSPLSELPWWLLAAGHTIYGLVLGWRAYPKRLPVLTGGRPIAENHPGG